MVYFTVAGFILGSVLGSFSKALADRSLANKSYWGRSYCPKCQHKLAWYDLFPILSYIFLKGKCRYCHKKIGIEYLFIEVAMGLLIGFLFWQTPVVIVRSHDLIETTWQSVLRISILLSDLISKIFFVVILMVLFLTDLKKMFIPDRIILPAILIGAVSLLMVILMKIGYLYYYLTESSVGQKLLPPYSDYFQRHALVTAQPFFLSLLMGALIGGFFFSLIVVTKGKGMGGGDMKLGVFIGVMLGFPYSLFALVLSFLTGAVFSLALVIAGKKHLGQTIPFGPFLVLGSFIMLFWGSEIANWYLNLRI